MHYLSWPFLAGLAEIERTAPVDTSQWNDDRVRTALGFYYCTFSNFEPPWYRRLLAERPKILAEAQAGFAVSELRVGRAALPKLPELAYDKGHAQVARYAALPLLRAFPTRCKSGQIESLGHLLKAAIQHADESALRGVIDGKLARKSMNDAQRVYWLAAGLAVAPTVYGEQLGHYAQGREGGFGT